MATTFQVKRSSVAGKVPNTSTLSIGELGLNLTDQVLYSSNGTGVFELGANVTNQTVKTSLLVGNSSVNTTVNSTSISIGANNLTVGTSLYAVSNGNVGIGDSSPSYPLDVNGNINSSNTIFAVHFDNVSDISLKENVTPLNDSINKLNNLYPVSFNWKSTKEQSFGLIAQEVEQILPQIVHQKDDGTKTVSYIQIIALLIDAVKDLQRQIDDINSNVI